MMTLNTLPSGLGALFVALALVSVGCSDVDEPTAEDYDNLAESVAPLLASDLSSSGSALVSVEVAVDRAPGWITVDASGEARGSVGGLSWDFVSRCADAAGNDMSGCDETTDGARVEARVAGDLSLPRLSASLDADAGWSIRGLQGERATMQGNAHFEAAAEFSTLLFPSTRAYAIAFDADYELEVATDGSRIYAGSASATIDARRMYSSPRRQSDAHFVVEATVTVDGDGRYTLTLDGAASYELNVEAGTVVRL